MLEELFEAASRAGLGLDMDGRARELQISLPAAAAEKGAIAVLYPLLAALEDHFLITIYGAPSCLMPDAFEHFAWPLGIRGPFRRIKACAGCALKGMCPGVNKSWTGRAALSPVLPAPSELVIELNKRCNLKCRACFGRTGEELPLISAEKALREAARLGVKNVRFTGGEPLLHPGLKKLLKLSRGLGFYTLLNTNAVLFSPAMARALSGLIDNALISLPGFDEVSHAAASGKAGAFGLKAAAAKRLRGAGVKVLRAGSVISKPLIKNLPRWHRSVSALGFDIWELYRPMLTPEGLQAAPEFILSKRDLASLAGKVAAQRPGGARAVLANPVPFCALPAVARPFALGARFDDGWTRLVLDPCGKYKASYPSRRFLGSTLLSAWQSPFLKKMRGAAWLPARCRRCSMLAVCRAGSRFQAGAAGAELGADPWIKL